MSHLRKWFELGRKRGYSILITPNDSTNSKSFFLSNRILVVISAIIIILVIIVIVAVANYSSVYYKALEADILRRRNVQLEKEFVKIKEIRENLRIAEMDNKKIKTMLGIDKAPELVEPEIVEVSPNYTNIGALREENENIPSLLPTMGQISRSFSPRHQGIDIAAPQFSPVIAAASGMIIDASWDSLYGNYIIIEHNKNYSTFYGHLNSIDVGKSVRVNAGQIIGTTGSTGKSTSPHLHYEVRFRNEPVDPMGYLPSFVKL